MTNNLELFRVPEKIYLKKGSLPVALRELKEVYNKKNVLILVSDLLHQEKAVQQITNRLHEMQISYTVSEWYAVRSLISDCILAYGGDADLAATAKIVTALTEKPYYITVPAYLGTYAHVMPLPDERFPDMTIIDTDVMQLNSNIIKSALTAALSALASEKATECSDSMAVKAVQTLLNAPDCSAEQLANAGTLAGCALSNAHAVKQQFSGHEAICAEKLGMKTELLLEKLKAVAFNF